MIYPAVDNVFRELKYADGNISCQDSGVSQIFVLIISNGEKILSNVNVVGLRQVQKENSSLPVAVRVSKTCVLKLPIHLLNSRGQVAWL